ncbi:MAG TPA: DUF3159 domain-containing protein [Capillimicrobium sp.]|nr:DUF3159 domain-containing protein [Capillimicrobium sp.]
MTAPQPETDEQLEAPPRPGVDEAPTVDSMLAAAGGPLGIAESTLPAVAFVIAVTASGRDIRLAAIIAVAIAAVFALARVVRRQTPLYAVSGVIGVAIAGWIASRTGKAENFFLPGLLMNAAYAGAFLISIVVRRPLVGVVFAGLSKQGSAWREDPARLRAFTRASWIFVVLFLARIAVQLPLYLADALVALGTARVAMGLPLFIVGLWLTWLVLRGTEGRRLTGGGEAASA